MTRSTWKHNNIRISFSKPQITAFCDTTPITNIESAMYFYYEVTMLKGNKTLMTAKTHDFPKVTHLPKAIDYMVNSDMSDAQVLENFDEDGKGRSVKYLRFNLEDEFDMEYSITLERTQYHVIPYQESVDEEDEDVERVIDHYTLSIGHMIQQYDKKKDCYNNSHVETFSLKYLKKEDLIQLKETAERFCQMAVDDYMTREYPGILAYALESGDDD